MRLLSLCVVLCCLFGLLATAGAEDKTDVPLQGIWQATSVETEGKAAPAEAVARMRFTFKGDKLLLRGNFEDDREETCTFQLDTKESPQHLDVTPPKQQKPTPGIYELKGDVLKICLRHASSDAGRPTEFATTPDSKLILIVFKRETVVRDRLSLSQMLNVWIAQRLGEPALIVARIVSSGG